MSSKSINQKGFTVVEGLLVLVILAIIAGVGYYVFQANSKATDTQNAAQTAANTAAPQKQGYLTVKEWGVRIPLNNPILKGATYKYEDLSKTIPPTPASEGTSTATISAPYTANVTITCQGSSETIKGFSRTITRFNNKTDADNVADVQDGPDAVLKVGSHYYEFGKVIEGDCDISASDAAKTVAYRNALFDAFKEMTATAQH